MVTGYQFPIFRSPKIRDTNESTSFYVMPEGHRKGGTALVPATPAAEGVPHGGMGGARTDGDPNFTSRHLGVAGASDFSRIAA